MCYQLKINYSKISNNTYVKLLQIIISTLHCDCHDDDSSINISQDVSPYSHGKHNLQMSRHANYAIINNVS